MSSDSHPHHPRRGVEEHNESDDYLQKRQLKTGTAGWLLLASLGVGYVISGDYSGWNFGLGQGGFGGLAIAAVIIAGMYLALVLGMAEMSSALPAAGGGYTFARRALGPWGGFATGTAILIEYAIAPAARRCVAARLRPVPLIACERSRPPFPIMRGLGNHGPPRRLNLEFPHSESILSESAEIYHKREGIPARQLPCHAALRWTRPLLRRSRSASEEAIVGRVDPCARSLERWETPSSTDCKYDEYLI